MARFAPRYARPRRSVRLHLAGAAPGEVQSIEGVLIGRWRGVYVLELARAVSGVGRSHAVEGYVEVDAARVSFMQVIPAEPTQASVTTLLRAAG